MKQAKRVVVGIVAALLVLLLFTGCTKQEKPAAEKVNLTALQYEVENQSIDFENLWFFQQIEEETGVHVNFDEVKDPDWVTRLSLMFVSGNLHDLILRGSLDIEDYGVNQHLVLPLDEYLDEYMPNYTEKLYSDNTYKTFTASDGKTYSIGFLISQGINTRAHFFINKTWLDKLGLSVPTTIDELTDVLRCFRDSDPNGNGINDEIPYQATLNDANTSLYNVFGMFGVPLNSKFVHVKDGKVMFAPSEPGFRKCAEWLHMLYSEKLLDVESLTQDSNLWAAKINRDTCGFFCYWRLGNSAVSPAVGENFVCMLPVSSDCHDPVMPREDDIVEFGAALSSQNSDIPASMRWLDAQFDTENMLVSQNGKIGETLRLRDDGKYEIIYVPSNNDLYSIVPVICGQFYAPENYYSSIYVPASHRAEKQEYCRMYEEGGVLEEVPFTLLVNVSPKTCDESIRIQQLYMPLRDTVNSALVDFITKGVTDANYSKFISDLEKIGMDEYVATYQDSYDRYMNKTEGELKK